MSTLAARAARSHAPDIRHFNTCKEEATLEVSYGELALLCMASCAPVFTPSIFLARSLFSVSLSSSNVKAAHRSQSVTGETRRLRGASQCATRFRTQLVAGNG